MSPVIQATIALNFCTIVGMVAGYYLRTFTHHCPEPPPLARIGALATGYLRLEGPCEIAGRFVDVDRRGSFTVEIVGEELAAAIDQVRRERGAS